MDIKQIITDRILASIESGTPKWQKPWVNGLNRNPATGTVFAPVNQLFLQAAGFTDPRWYTPNWCKQNGVNFKGAKMEWITSYVDIYNKDDAAGSEIIATNGRSFKVPKAIGLFNAEQLTGVPKLSDELGLPEFQSVEMMEQIIRAAIAHGMQVSHGGQKAYYIEKADAITLPAPQFFLSTYDYYATLTHEAMHWTGHPSRENRVLTGKFGTDDYAFEELVAEIGSAMLMGIVRGEPSQAVIGQHAAYIQSWMRILKKDNGAFLKAASLASAAVKRVLLFVPELAMESGLFSDEEAACIQVPASPILEKKPTPRLIPHL